MTKKSAPKRRPTGDGRSAEKALSSTSRICTARLARTLLKGVCAAVTRSTIETLWSWLSS
ncbi:hypothetical protein OG775_37765 [Streptomyces platensis]|uniref:hypothetical protein n=1 Tax=Streptomyces platensis TaxID=58346 RepID=UPI00224D68BC|nr:hypothetical protein [Streptomyces platensis]MCX4640785.1 hypothetical protein [Streptomyces platensis]